MTSEEYEQEKQRIEKDLGKPEWDMKEPMNDSAKALHKLLNEYKSSIRISREDQKKVVKDYKTLPAVPIYLTETDLELFTEEERSVVEDYFSNTNQTPMELARKHKGFTRQKVVALQRSGPFSILCERLYAPLMALEVKNALLKAIRDGNAKILERMAEQTGALRSQEMNLNINKPLEVDNPELLRKLKDLGDSEA